MAQGKGKPPKLDDKVLETVREAMVRGLSEKDAAAACGVTDRTWYYWKERARAAAEVLPEDWERLRYDELLACLDELGINRDYIRKTGAGGRRLTRDDVIDTLRSRAARYLEFLREIQAAGPQAKLAILTRLDDLIQGRAKAKKTRTVQRVVLPDGREAIVTTEVFELPPDRQAALKMLAMRWPEEFGNQGGAQDDAEQAAKTVTDAVHRMLTTVPQPPALPPAPEETET